MDKTRKKAVMLMALCALLWSTGGLLIKLLDWNALVIAGGRSVLSAAVVLIYMKVRRQPLRWTKHTFISAVMLAGTLLCFVAANKLTTAANAIVLQYCAPVFVLIYSSLFFKVKFRRLDVVTVLITLGGMSLFFLDSLSPGNMAGNLLAILGGMCFAGMMVSSARADDDSCMTGIFFGHLLTAVVGLPFALVYETPISVNALLVVTALGVFQLGIPYILYGLATRSCPPLACSLISTVEPLLNPVWVLIFTGETPGLFALIGGIIVLGSVTAWCVLNGRKETA